ncbi:retrotransposon protein, putative, unclassified [Cucumis melo var. makuwa]|uniref:Retrotransposon protein, putative, unclassified n=1 Tax=Cucumis melo var. makuwa TaxID=1194695 RepID=A0A5A7SRI0_CUCMM|nr:retrotransposon protein, putative, unclassified [Cucumis melo var. makuwa]
MEGASIDAMEYISIVGCLRYLLNTRPDLSYVVGMASRYIERPTTMHHKVVKQILSDLVGDLNGRKSTSGMAFYLNESLVSWNFKRTKPPCALHTKTLHLRRFLPFLSPPSTPPAAAAALNFSIFERRQPLLPFGFERRCYHFSSNVASPLPQRRCYHFGLNATSSFP